MTHLTSRYSSNLACLSRLASSTTSSIRRASESRTLTRHRWVSWRYITEQLPRRSWPHYSIHTVQDARERAVLQEHAPDQSLFLTRCYCESLPMVPRETKRLPGWRAVSGSVFFIGENKEGHILGMNHYKHL